MKYYYLDRENVEHGPVDDSELIYLTNQGEIVPDSQVRAYLSKDFRNANKFNFLAESLNAYQELLIKEKKDLPKGSLKTFSDKFNVQNAKTTSFTNSKFACSAKLSSRLYALAFDVIILLLVLTIMIFPVLKLNRTVNINENAQKSQEKQFNSETISAKKEVPPKNIQADYFKETSKKSKKPKNIKVDETKKTLNRAKSVARVAIGGGSGSSSSNTAPEKTEKKVEASKLEKEIIAKLEDTKKIMKSFSIYKIEQNASKIKVKVSQDKDYTYNKAKLYKWLNITILLYAIIVFLYYSIGLSYFSQTLGMWYFGIFLTKNNLQEVFFLRSFIYTICMFIFGILMIPMVFFTNRSMAEWLTNTKVIYVYSKEQ